MIDNKEICKRISVACGIKSTCARNRMCNMDIKVNCDDCDGFVEDYPDYFAPINLVKMLEIDFVAGNSIEGLIFKVPRHGGKSFAQDYLADVMLCLEDDNRADAGFVEKFKQGMREEIWRR